MPLFVHCKQNGYTKWALGNTVGKRPRVNSLPSKKILDLSKLKDLQTTREITQKLKFLLRRVENIVGKGENAGYQHFLLFLQCIQKPSSSGSVKAGIEW